MAENHLFVGGRAYRFEYSQSKNSFGMMYMARRMTGDLVSIQILVAREANGSVGREVGPG